MHLHLHLYLFPISELVSPFQFILCWSPYSSLLLLLLNLLCTHTHTRTHGFFFVYKINIYIFIFYFSLLHCSNYISLLHASFFAFHSFRFFLSILCIRTHTMCIVVALAHTHTHIHTCSLWMLSFVKDAFFLLHSFKAAYDEKKIAHEKKETEMKKEWLNSTTSSDEWEEQREGMGGMPMENEKRRGNDNTMPFHATTWYSLQFHSVIVYFTLIFAPRISLASLARKECVSNKIVQKFCCFCLFSSLCQCQCLCAYSSYIRSGICNVYISSRSRGRKRRKTANKASNKMQQWTKWAMYARGSIVSYTPMSNEYDRNTKPTRSSASNSQSAVCSTNTHQNTSNLILFYW